MLTVIYKNLLSHVTVNKTYWPGSVVNIEIGKNVLIVF